MKFSRIFFNAYIRTKNDLFDVLNIQSIISNSLCHQLYSGPPLTFLTLVTDELMVGGVISRTVVLSGVVLFNTVLLSVVSLVTSVVQVSVVSVAKGSS